MLFSLDVCYHCNSNCCPSKCYGYGAMRHGNYFHYWEHYGEVASSIDLASGQWYVLWINFYMSEKLVACLPWVWCYVTLWDVIVALSVVVADAILYDTIWCLYYAVVIWELLGWLTDFVINDPISSCSRMKLIADSTLASAMDCSQWKDL